MLEILVLSGLLFTIFILYTIEKNDRIQLEKNRKEDEKNRQRQLENERNRLSQLAKEKDKRTYQSWLKRNENEKSRKRQLEREENEKSRKRQLEREENRKKQLEREENEKSRKRQLEREESRKRQLEREENRKRQLEREKLDDLYYGKNKLNNSFVRFHKNKIIKVSKTKLNENEIKQIVVYLWIYNKYSCSEHWEVNKIISQDKRWKDFNELRSYNDHGYNSKIKGITPKYFAIICSVLDILPSNGNPLLDYEKY